jgi:hypothetical protein
MSPILMHQMRISTTQVSSVMLRSKKMEIREKMWKLKGRRMKIKQEYHEMQCNAKDCYKWYMYKINNEIETNEVQKNKKYT